MTLIFGKDIKKYQLPKKKKQAPAVLRPGVLREQIPTASQNVTRAGNTFNAIGAGRSEEHTSELQSH